MSQLGEVSILYVWDTSAYKPIACLTSNGLSSSLAVTESTTKCNPGVVTQTPGKFSYTIPAEGEYIDTTSGDGDTAKASHDYLLTKQMAKTLLTWKIDTNVNNPTSIKYYGTAYITDLEATFPSGDEVATFSTTLAGNGAITQVDPNE